MFSIFCFSFLSIIRPNLKEIFLSFALINQLINEGGFVGAIITSFRRSGTVGVAPVTLRPKGLKLQ
jgi:hypothetical protein